MVSDGGRRHADMTITGRPSRSEPDSHEGGGGGGGGGGVKAEVIGMEKKMRNIHTS